ncbi:MAG: hypothetical protein DIU60_006505 [Actinomycetes bacterium]|jgi:hypothetical protein|nr:MAG: hypothetical protein DIU60_17285 [Actinomycetota bacterium]
MSEHWTDEELLARLADYLRAAEQIPPHLIAAAKAAITELRLDPDLAACEADLAELCSGHGLARPAFDSALTGGAASPVRSPGFVRALTFVGAGLTIELEIRPDALTGRLLPATPGEVRLHTLGGEVITLPADRLGRFALRGAVTGPFRLHCRTGSGKDVSTTWIVP